MRDRVPDRLPWPLAVAVIMVLSPLLGVAMANVVATLVDLAR